MSIKKEAINTDRKTKYCRIAKFLKFSKIKSSV